ncbi:MAG: lamin tail domain-containing protein [Candidatus Nanohaloarchaea archaeon]|nr:lamin tail domain-containing protein [Candidatus Nanohaloarchaea archaeon]
MGGARSGKVKKVSLGNYAMLASIVASLVTIPAASATVTGDAPAVGATLVGSSEGEAAQLPKTVSTHRDADSMSATVETSLGAATFESSSNEFTAELEHPNYRVETTKSPDGSVRTYTSSSVEYTVDTTSTTIETRCRTPYGTMTTERDGGAVDTSFTGTRQEKVRSTCEQARQQMDDGLAKLASTAADLDMVQRQLEITALDEEEEYVEIENTGPIAADLVNWTVSDASGNTYTFDGTELAPGESVRVYSDAAAEDCSGHCWEATVWNNGGDTATLRNSEGKTMDSFSYGE